MKDEVDAIKNDEGKTEYHVIPSLALEEVCIAMKDGTAKYGAYNWAQGEGIAWSRYFNACMRHLWKFWRGKESDEISRRSHLAHAVACLLILLEMSLMKKGKDDRPKYYSDIP